jgi:hypothetical protein
VRWSDPVRKRARAPGQVMGTAVETSLAHLAGYTRSPLDDMCWLDSYAWSDAELAFASGRFASGRFASRRLRGRDADG